MEALPRLVCVLYSVSTPSYGPESRSALLVDHYGLCKGGVHHCDISAANLMYYQVNGEAMGVVNDFDLSTLAGSKCKFGNKRTGALAFIHGDRVPG